MFVHTLFQWQCFYVATKCLWSFVVLLMEADRKFIIINMPILLYVIERMLFTYEVGKIHNVLLLFSQKQWHSTHWHDEMEKCKHRHLFWQLSFLARKKAVKWGCQQMLVMCYSIFYLSSINNNGQNKKQINVEYFTILHNNYMRRQKVIGCENWIWKKVV